MSEFKLNIKGVVVAAVCLAGTTLAPVAMGSLADRVERLEQMIESRSLTEMYIRLEEIQAELQKIRGELEEQAYAIENLKKHQRELYLDLDRRLQRLEQGGSAIPLPENGTPQGPSDESPATRPPAATTEVTPPPQPSAPTPVVTPRPAPPPAPAAPPTATPEEAAAYRASFNLLKEARYDEAISGFRAFLKKYTSSSYAANAQYWLGEAHYVTKKFKIAINEFNKVITTYPYSSKIPDTMLKIGYCYYELRDMKAATQTLTQLRNQFPGTTAAKLAEKRLQQIKIENR
jgi:tol-pal system protein YbgF